MTLPIFIFSMLLVAFMSVLMIYEDKVQWALTRTAREGMAMYGATDNEVYKSTAYYQGMVLLYLKDCPVHAVLAASEIDKETDEIRLVADYQVKLPFRLLPYDWIYFREQVHTRGFVGVETREKTEVDDVTVYVTKTGHVYHRKQDCTYLKLSISQVKYKDVPSLRNIGGAKYDLCEKCCKGKSFEEDTPVWITNYGDCYHSSSSCSGLKRYIREMKLSEVKNLAPCSKCGEE